MKRKDFLKEIRGLAPEDLTTKASELRRELMNLKFRAASGQLTHTSQLRALRESIARVETVAAQKSASKS